MLLTLCVHWQQPRTPTPMSIAPHWEGLLFTAFNSEPHLSASGVSMASRRVPGIEYEAETHKRRCI